MQRTTQFLPFLQARRREYDAVLFDIDGTLVDRTHTLGGAEEILAWLRAERLPFLCLTNDGNHSVAEKSRFLAKAGLHVAPSEIVSCAHAVFELAESAGYAGGRVFIMGNLGVRFPSLDADDLAADLPASPGTGDEIDLPPEPRQHVGPPDSNVFRETRQRELLPECDGVIVGEGEYDWQPVVTAVFNFFIHKPKAFMIVPNPDSYWPNGHRGLGIGAGSVARFVQGLLHEYGVEVKPTYLGKPYPLIFQHALHCLRKHHGAELGRKPERILVVGDSLRADIKGANDVGFRSVLVLTGLTKPKRLEDDLRRSGVQPWLVADGLVR